MHNKAEYDYSPVEADEAEDNGEEEDNFWGFTGISPKNLADIIKSVVSFILKYH